MVSGSGLKRGKEEWSEVIMENGVRRGIHLANLASCSRVLYMSCIECIECTCDQKNITIHISLTLQTLISSVQC